jgi:hypothetical protein
MIRRAAFILVAFSGLALAQQQSPPADSPPDTPAPAPTSNAMPAPAPSHAKEGPKSPEWKSLSAGEKLRYDWRHLFDVENLVFAGIGASFDQLRNRPGQWGQGWGPFGERYASHVGYYVIQRSIMFPVEALDHEDTRYFRSTRTSYQGRLADAFLHTIWRHSDSGHMMPAYSEFVGDYGAAAISRMWWPDSYHKASSILVAGSDTILVDAGINIFDEFKPDIKRWLHLNH